MPPAREPPPVTIDLSLRLSNGHYESSLKVPIDEAPNAEERVLAWLDMQMRYLSTIKPGENVRVQADLGGST